MSGAPSSSNTTANEAVNPNGILNPLLVSEQTRGDAKKYALEIAEKAGGFVEGQTVADLYFDTPIEEKTVVLIGLGANVKGNLLAMLDELNSSPRFEGYTIYVRALASTREAVEAFVEQRGWSRTKVAVSTKDYDRILASANYLLAEANFPLSWVKKPGQTSINIWHGTPLKKLGSDKKYRCNHSDGVKQRDFINVDYFLYPNRYTEMNMSTAYRVNKLMRGSAVLSGYPRTGTLLKSDPERRNHLKQTLAPNGEAIYAFMPTWKDYLDAEEVVKESLDLLRYLDKGLNDNQILYVNLHHKVSDSVDYSEFTHIRKFPSDMDNYELLSVTDTLITDYSSVFFDFLATRRQIILYCHDYEKYAKRRGTYTNLMKLPFDKALTKEEVLVALKRGKTYEDDRVFNKFCEFDSQDNARKVCSLLSEAPDEDVRIEPISIDALPNVLIYDERCQPGSMTDMLNELVNRYSSRKYNLFVACEKNQVNENKDSAYPMLFNVPTLGTDTSNLFLSSLGSELMRLIETEAIGLNDAENYLKFDFALSAQRLFGRADYKMAVIYDVIDPRILMLLACMRIPTTLFVTDEIIERIENGDKALEALTTYAAKASIDVLVSSKQSSRKVVHLLSDCKKPTVIRTAKALNRYIRKKIKAL